MHKINFISTEGFERGIIYRLLTESYANLLDQKPAFKADYIASWKKADEDTFDHPETIGKSTLISTYQDAPIGFISWDPRKVPDLGIIGQNCILPDWRGYGFGKQQIEMVINIFKSQYTASIQVTTDNHPFFIPAQRTYKSCGFREIGRSYSTSYGGIELVYYELRLVQQLKI